MDSHAFNALSLALGLGLLIGLQRERSGSEFGGVRTFPLVSMLGVVCGMLAVRLGAIVVVAGLLAVTVLTVMANLQKLRAQNASAGQTSEAAALIAYSIGALLALETYGVALVIGGITAVLLHFKHPLHSFVGRLDTRDVEAIMRFVILTLIVIPLLPDRTYGPFNVLNPRDIWWMVVLIVGMGLAGYVSYKIIGERLGIVLTGMLGGLVSSTATTVAYARRIGASRNGNVASAAVVVVIASTVAVARVIVEIAIIAPTLLLKTALPLAVLLAVLACMATAMYVIVRSSDEPLPPQGNPAELKTALAFGAIYALVTFGTAAVRAHMGEQGLFAVAFVSGLVDVDAITLSAARLTSTGQIDPSTAWRLIMIASLVNLGFKAGAALFFGSFKLFVRVGVAFLLAIATGTLLLIAWPDGGTVTLG